ncbi:hypothetical protein KL86CLO1_13426 [uncultured Eubacteriales bacterium]|uniref:Uncharacterized protein n=1 Tax=uncultured Eubacteriales bacterium TaxID=172733 RepID=A0A212KJR2_9FIRM|nr:hypothetical protein KL86CLO1_13426 [uncultured Eubacteriales bacterium]
MQNYRLAVLHAYPQMDTKIALCEKITQSYSVKILYCK